ENFHLCDLGNDDGITSAGQSDRTHPHGPLLVNIAFDKSTAVQKVVHYGPSRRSSIIASEIGGLPSIAASISASSFASSISLRGSSSYCTNRLSSAARARSRSERSITCTSCPSIKFTGSSRRSHPCL